MRMIVEPSLIDLEMRAVQQGTFDGHGKLSEPKDIFWYKKEIYSKWNGEIGPLHMGNNAVQLAEQRKGSAFIGRKPEGTRVKKNTSLGNLICFAESREALREEIRAAERLIAQYVPRHNEYALTELAEYKHAPFSNPTESALEPESASPSPETSAREEPALTSSRSRLFDRSSTVSDVPCSVPSSVVPSSG